MFGSLRLVQEHLGVISIILDFIIYNALWNTLIFEHSKAKII